MNIAIASCPEHNTYAKGLATQLAMPMLKDSKDKDVDGVLFFGDRLELTIKNKGKIYVDFLNGKTLWRKHFGGGKNQALAKAIGVKGSYRPSIIDATAGLGQDAFVFASLGSKVSLIERSPLIGALLEDGLRRARADNESKSIALRMDLHFADANELIPKLAKHEVIYLDPMYPPTNKSSLPKKEMQILRALLDEQNDKDELLWIAREFAEKRVVVKRPKGAPYIANIVPDSKITTKHTRFDVYLTFA